MRSIVFCTKYCNILYKIAKFNKNLKLTNQNDNIMTAPRFQIFLNLLKWGYRLGNSGLLERNCSLKLKYTQADNRRASGSRLGNSGLLERRLSINLKYTQADNRRASGSRLGNGSLLERNYGLNF